MSIRDLMTMFDGGHVPVTRDMQEALIAYMRAECEMMRAHEPALAACWTWGRCFVGDLARTDALRFEYGGNHDQPGDGLGDFAVVVEDESP